MENKTKKVKCNKCVNGFYSGSHGQTACELCDRGYIWKEVSIRKKRQVKIISSNQLVSGNEALRVAVAFADWIYRNDWEKFPTDISANGEILHTTRWYKEGNERFTTEQLYDEFQKAKATDR